MDEFDQFLDQLASGAPVPGGGSVAAIQVAMAAALLVMVCNLTIDRPRYAVVDEEARGLKATAEGYCAQARGLAREDAAAYDRVATSMRLPRGDERERTRRTDAVQAALKAAVAPPLTCMEVATRVLAAAERLVEIGNRNAVSDVGVAAVAARAGFRAARFNAEINLAAIRDRAWTDRRRAQMELLADPEEMERRVVARVDALIAGSAR